MHASNTLKSEWDLTDAQRAQLRLLFALVQSLHKKGMVHKDLDLNNIMVCEDNSWRLIDFGSAAAQISATPRFAHKLSVPMQVALRWFNMNQVGAGPVVSSAMASDARYRPWISNYARTTRVGHWLTHGDVWQC